MEHKWLAIIGINVNLAEHCVQNKARAYRIYLLPGLTLWRTSVLSTDKLGVRNMER